MTGFSNPIIGGGGALVYPAIHSPGFDEATQTGWSIDKNGDAYFYGITTSGEFTGLNFIINKLGAFFYDGTPASGNPPVASISTGTADPFGNTVYQFISSQDGGTVAQLIDGFAQFQIVAFTKSAASIGIQAAGLNGQQLAISSGTGPEAGAAAGILTITDSGFGDNGVPLLSWAGVAAIAAAASAGQLLTVENTTSGPSDSNVQLTGAAAGDNMLGIRVGSESNNRLKIDSDGVHLWGPGGSSTQDTRLYRAAAGELAADTILANISGSAETWHSLGGLSGTGSASATVNMARYRMMPDGTVLIEIDVTVGVSTAEATWTFANTLPAAYRPDSAGTDIRAPIAQTNTPATLARVFVGAAGGTSAGKVQIAGTPGGTYLGTYSAQVRYSVI